MNYKLFVCMAIGCLALILVAALVSLIVDIKEAFTDEYGDLCWKDDSYNGSTSMEGLFYICIFIITLVSQFIVICCLVTVIKN